MVGRDGGMIDARLAGPRLNTRGQGVAARKRSHVRSRDGSFSSTLNGGELRVGRLGEVRCSWRYMYSVAINAGDTAPPKTPQPQSLDSGTSGMEDPKIKLEAEESRDGV
jgi:hypothetical protein